jgi:hypothetical protein
LLQELNMTVRRYTATVGAGIFVAGLLNMIFNPEVTANPPQCDGTSAVKSFCPEPTPATKCKACTNYQCETSTCGSPAYNARDNYWTCSEPNSATPNKLCMMKLQELPPGEPGPPAPLQGDCYDYTPCTYNIFQGCILNSGVTVTITAQLYETFTCPPAT